MLIAMQYFHKQRMFPYFVRDGLHHLHVDAPRNPEPEVQLRRAAGCLLYEHLSCGRLQWHRQESGLPFLLGHHSVSRLHG